MPQAPRAVVFDLDGTLVDSLDDITAAMNHALGTVGRPLHDRATYQAWIGDGLRTLAERAIGDADVATLEEVLVTYRAHYQRHMTAHTRIYPGVESLLSGLRARSVRLAVLSNKGDEATRALVTKVFADGIFDDVRGLVPGTPPKPDPTSALAQLARLGVGPDEALFVGDTEIDVGTARNAGMRMVAVAWGFRPIARLREEGADEMLTNATDLLARFD